MNTLEKLKLSKALQQAIIARDKSRKPLEKLKFSKEVQSLRQQLGLITVINSKDKISSTGTSQSKEEEETVDDNLPELILPENPNREELYNIAQDYLKNNLQGKKLLTVDGKTVHFNRDQSVDHFSFNAQIGKLETKVLSKIAEVFTSGEFIKREELYKERRDRFVAFHIYRKKVEINEMNLLLQVKAGEKDSGKLEVTGKLIGYSHKLLDSINETGNAPPVLTSPNGERPSGGYVAITEENNTILDDTQEQDDYLVEILEIRDKEGNLIDLDQLDKAANTEENPQSSPNLVKTTADLMDKTANEELFNYNEEGVGLRTRQKRNDAAIAIVKQLQSGELKYSDITDDQRKTLSLYSGSGGGVVSADGIKGSAYEYYTPKATAKGMWDLLQSYGFTAGTVLDPCAGTGVFSAVAPKEALIQSVELDAVSGTINKALFEGGNKTVSIQPFEEYAKATEDESVDAVIANVPFGDNRGSYKFLDERYQDESLDGYFILRSLDKLKPGRVAVFMSSSAVISNKSKENLRKRIALKAEFIGAYRMPNKLFTTAGADVVTDVMVLRKHTKANKQIIDDVYKENPALLTEANVFRDTFINGRYFETEGKRYILGKTTQVKSRYGEQVLKVVNDDSIANISRMMTRFGDDSAIKWDLLDAVPPTEEQYQEGDMIYFGGEQKVFKNGAFVPVENTGNVGNSEVIDIAEKAKAFDDTALNVFEHNERGLAELYDLLAQARQRNLILNTVFRDWVINLLDFKAEKNKRLVTIIHAFMDAREEKTLDSKLNLAEKYPNLSEAIKAIVLQGPKKAPGGCTAEQSNAFKAILNLVYDKKAKAFTEYWRGEFAETEEKTLTPRQIYEQELYKNGHTADQGIELNRFKALFPDVDLDNSDDWVYSLDGKKIISINDHFVGNVGKLKDKYREAIAKADDALKERLINQMQLINERVAKVDLNKINLSLTTSFIDPQDKINFLNTYVARNSGTFYLEEKDDGGFKYAFKEASSKDKSNRNAILRRIAFYLNNNGSVSSGVKIKEEKDIKRQEEILAGLKREIDAINAQFDSAVKRNKRLLGKLDDLLNNDDVLQFVQVEDDTDIHIEGINSNFSPRPHQSAFVRQQARQMGGICGFDVGLGKTYTALMVAQHLQSINVKKKTLFVVPNTTLTNWRKEAESIYTEEVFNRCLFVGIREKNGSLSIAGTKEVTADIASIYENKHDKIFMTFTNFIAIMLKKVTIEDYLDYVDMANGSGKSLGHKDLQKKEQKLGELGKIIASQMKASFVELEGMGIDSLVIDEAHIYKNAVGATFGGAKFLSVLGKPSAGAANALAKTWYIRKGNVKNDGVLCLTATPITNSPQEIYSMLSLANGEDYVNKMVGVSGVNNFLETFCNIDNTQQRTVDDRLDIFKTFTGFKNSDILRRLFNSVTTMKNADDIKEGSTYIPEGIEVVSNVAISKEQQNLLDEYRKIYRLARLQLKESTKGLMTEEQVKELDAAVAAQGVNIELLAHPFNFVNKLSQSLLDPNIAEQKTVYYIKEDKDLDAAKKAVEAFNKLEKSGERPNKIGLDESDILDLTFVEVGGESNLKKAIYKYRVKADIEGNKITLNCADQKLQNILLKMLEKVPLKVDISAKMAALVDNVRSELAHPKANGGLCKQIIFSDILASHNAIKILLTDECGIPADKIKIINAEVVPDQGEMQDIQDGFNAEAEDNRYSIIIANKKAEVGINLQKGTQAIHHLTVGWTPDSLQQRNGRGVRQGNYVDEVQIYQYDVNGTFDKYKRKIVNSKSDWISELVRGENSVVNIEGGLSNEDMEILASISNEEELQQAIDSIEKRQKDNFIKAKQTELHSMADVMRTLRQDEEVFKDVSSYRNRSYRDLNSLQVSINKNYINVINELENKIRDNEIEGKSTTTLNKRLDKLKGNAGRYFNEIQSLFRFGEISELVNGYEDEFDAVKKFCDLNLSNKLDEFDEKIQHFYEEDLALLNDNIQGITDKIEGLSNTIGLDEELKQRLIHIGENDKTYNGWIPKEKDIVKVKLNNEYYYGAISRIYYMGDVAIESLEQRGEIRLLEHFVNPSAPNASSERWFYLDKLPNNIEINYFGQAADDKCAFLFKKIAEVELERIQEGNEPLYSNEGRFTFADQVKPYLVDHRKMIKVSGFASYDDNNYMFFSPDIKELVDEEVYKLIQLPKMQEHFKKGEEHYDLKRNQETGEYDAPLSFNFSQLQSAFLPNQFLSNFSRILLKTLKIINGDMVDYLKYLAIKNDNIARSILNGSFWGLIDLVNYQDFIDNLPEDIAKEENAKEKIYDLLVKYWVKQKVVDSESNGKAVIDIGLNLGGLDDNGFLSILPNITKFIEKETYEGPAFVAMLGRDTYDFSTRTKLRDRAKSFAKSEGAKEGVIGFLYDRTGGKPWAGEFFATVPNLADVFTKYGKCWVMRGDFWQYLQENSSIHAFDVYGENL